ncbi:MAG: acetate kinase [Chloroflexota bacterium]
MQVLVINSGSSTLKFDLVDVLAGDSLSSPQTIKLAHGMVDRIGGEATFEIAATSGQSIARHSVDAPSHREATALALDALLRQFPGGINAVGHRVVHGGDRFVAPTVIDKTVMDAIGELSELAPLHNPGALDGIKGVLAALGDGVPMVAVFDTAFHSSLPDYAYTYALPHEIAERNKIRRYGFHGVAHEYMMLQYAAAHGVDPTAVRLITLQLGNGCSAAAIRGGRSVDTSMGFTPLEGLVMGTRSGDVDASVVSYLVAKEGVEASEVETWLNKRSGLLGISGTASDMRTLLASVAAGDRRAELAVEVFCYRVRKYIGAYMAALGGADAVVFGGGIGENAPAIRARILAGMEWCGLQLDSDRNEQMVGKQGAIGTDGGVPGIFVVQVDESLLIARQTAAALGFE